MGIICFALSVGFIYLAARLARLARQCIKDQSVGFIYLAARLALVARQWMYERGIICMMFSLRCRAKRATKYMKLMFYAREVLGSYI